MGTEARLSRLLTLLVCNMPPPIDRLLPQGCSWLRYDRLIVDVMAACCSATRGISTALGSAGMLSVMLYQAASMALTCERSVR
jgi:hypothetical protein